MISDWRRRFSTDGSSDPLAPFLFVQLAGWHGDKARGIGGLPCMIEGGDGGGEWEQGAHARPGQPPTATFGGAVPAQRLAQLAAFDLPAVGMACTVDLGDAAGPFWPGSIHPRQKQPVGRRLALEARRIAYGEAGLVTRGPQIQRIEWLPGDAPYGSYHSKAVQIARLHWNSTGSGLEVARGGYGNVVFIATLNNTMAVPGTILPTNLTADSCDVYFDLGYNWNAANDTCARNKWTCVPYITRIDHLPYDFPVAALFNSEGLPAEPFARNTSRAPGPAHVPAPAPGDMARRAWPLH